MIPLDRTRGDLGAMKKTIAALRGGQVVGLFPEGTRSVDGELQAAKGGVGFLMAKAGVPVVPKSKKLLQFTLDDGTGVERTILSGIHAFYEPEELVGKTLIAITNLPPRAMMGIESCGMLLSDCLFCKFCFYI